MTSEVPLKYLAHLLTVPVRVAGIDAVFILDTGIGVNLISTALASRAGFESSGVTFRGRRMSGQEVTAPMGSLPSLQLADRFDKEVPAALLDMGAMAGLEGIDGFLSLQYFRELPFTIDYSARVLVLEDEESLGRRVGSGAVVAVRIKDEGAAVDADLELRLPSGRVITVEVDAGSDMLILNEPLAAEVGVDLAAAEVRRVDGEDETGHSYVRYFATIDGAVSLADAPEFRQVRPDTQFQEIIFDGLVGDRFLRNFVVTYDLPRSRMVFAFHVQDEG